MTKCKKCQIRKNIKKFKKRQNLKKYENFFKKISNFLKTDEN